MKIVIVTGSTGNMGQAIAKKFITEGHFVIGTVTANDATIPDLPTNRFEKVIVDLLDETASQQFVDDVVSRYGRIDTAVLTVGGFAMGTVETTPATDIAKQYKLNFEATYNVARPAFVQMLKQNGGRIFMTGSRPGLDAKSGNGMVAYGLAKSLVFRLADLMNDEAKGRNVVASVVVPSTIDTPLNRKNIPDASFENWVKPESIADVLYWYCTDEALALREPLIKVYNNA